ncbi:hypothetical protein [Pinibacter soli]|uniref:Uncharacterized protein n=1 Tax=Pinibacter soli TaxID=3044211 RepID=A0ABT6RJE9_9BACT|nr:hypothetical protein [Pinibacter soli]MDI3322688.1 hypothetical protein [Pinibacter soli]
MTKFWKITNGAILIIQLITCSVGTFFKHISFGWGLGDMLWYGLMYLLLIIHFILTITSKNKKAIRFQLMTIIFLATTIFICLKATIWRGVEYPGMENYFTTTNVTKEKKSPKLLQNY